MKLSATVNNVPQYSLNDKWIVARPDCTEFNEFWFYGSYDNFNTASITARECGGFVFENEKIS